VIKIKKQKMKKKVALILFFLIISGIFSVFFFSAKVSAQGLAPEPGWTGIVPCGRNTGTNGETDRCTLCHLVVGIQRIFTYGLYIVIAIAFVAFFAAGIMYMLSTGDPGIMESAKKFMITTLVGFAIVAGAWLIVNVSLWAVAVKGDLGVSKGSWFAFSCSTISASTIPTTPPTPPTPPVPPTPGTTCGNENYPGVCTAGSRCAEGYWVMQGGSCGSGQICCSQKWKCTAAGSKICLQDPAGKFTSKESCESDGFCGGQSTPCQSQNGMRTGICTMRDPFGVTNPCPGAGIYINDGGCSGDTVCCVPETTQKYRCTAGGSCDPVDDGTGTDWKTCNDSCNTSCSGENQICNPNTKPCCDSSMACVGGDPNSPKTMYCKKPEDLKYQCYEDGTGCALGINGKYATEEFCSPFCLTSATKKCEGPMQMPSAGCLKGEQNAARIYECPGGYVRYWPGTCEADDEYCCVEKGSARYVCNPTNNKCEISNDPNAKTMDVCEQNCPVRTSQAVLQSIEFQCETGNIIDSVYLSALNPNGELPGEMQVKAYGRFANGDYREITNEVTWVSSDETKLQVEGGFVRALENEGGVSEGGDQSVEQSVEVQATYQNPDGTKINGSVRAYCDYCPINMAQTIEQKNKNSFYGLFTKNKILNNFLQKNNWLSSLLGETAQAQEGGCRNCSGKAEPTCKLIGGSENAKLVYIFYKFDGALKGYSSVCSQVEGSSLIDGGEIINKTGKQNVDWAGQEELFEKIARMSASAILSQVDSKQDIGIYMTTLTGNAETVGSVDENIEQSFSGANLDATCPQGDYYTGYGFVLNCHNLGEFGGEDAFHTAYSMAGTKVTMYSSRQLEAYPATATHELGHNFGYLEDEYIPMKDESGVCRMGTQVIINCTKDIKNVNGNTECEKWKSQGLGCFKGCVTPETYRSTNNSLMNDAYSDSNFSKIQKESFENSLKNGFGNFPSYLVEKCQ